MRYKLIAPVQEKSTFAQVLLNRGVQREDINKFTTTTIKDISKPELFGKEKMEKAVKMVAQHIAKHSKTIIIVDPDVDGNTSSAVLLNYLYNFFPEWTESVKFYFHTGKQHGLNDCIDYIIENDDYDNLKAIIKYNPYVSIKDKIQSLKLKNKDKIKILKK